LFPPVPHSDLDKIVIHGRRFNRHARPVRQFPGCGGNSGNAAPVPGVSKAVGRPLANAFGCEPTGSWRLNQKPDAIILPCNSGRAARVVVDFVMVASCQGHMPAALFPAIEVFVSHFCEVVPARRLSARTLHPSPQRVVG
jgi:hypothetical protein